MAKRRVCVVVTARPSYSRIKSAMQAIKGHSDLELQLVVAASAMLERYGNVVKFIRQDGFQIDAQIYMVLEGAGIVTMAKTTGLGLIELATTFDNLKPDLVLTIGDRYETLATAIAASYMNIPLAHVQGGELTGSIDEKVRHAVTKLSNLHFVATELSAQRVIRMGEDPNAVFITGCPSIDLAASILPDPSLNFNPFDKCGGVGSRFSLSDGYIVVIQHPVTTEYTDSKRQVDEILHAIEELDLPSFWFWPNVDVGTEEMAGQIRAFRELKRPDNIHFFKNMVPEDFLRLLYNSMCVVGNSSIAIRECSFMGVPSVNIGTRQTRRERGTNVIDVGYTRTDIVNAIKRQLNRGRYTCDFLYGDGHAGERIANLIANVPLSIKKEMTY